MTADQGSGRETYSTTKNYSSCLEIMPTPGEHIADVFDHASWLAKTLRMNWVNFDFNGSRCTAYQDGRGLEFSGGASIAAEWYRLGPGRWERIAR
jgi:hypothetical protein